MAGELGVLRLHASPISGRRRGHQYPMVARHGPQAHLWCIVVVCLSLFAAGSSHAQSVIRLARIVDIPDQYVGGEMLRAVYAKLNIKLEFQDVPGKRALMLSSAGEIDGEIQRIGTLSRDYPTLLQVTPSINYIEPSVFTTRLHFNVEGWSSIRDYSIGIVRGVGSSEAGTRGMDRVTATTGIDNLIKMLDADRFDVIVTDLFSGKVAVRKLNLQARIYPLSPPLERIFIFHYLHERHRDLVPKVGEVIAQMQASGELAALREALIKQALSAL